MKTLLPLLILLTLSACQDAPLRRHNSCTRAADNNGACEYQPQLGAEFTKMFIAEVTVQAVIGQKQIAVKATERDEDDDGTYFCTLEVSAGAKFNYKIEKRVLTLTNGINTLTFNKTEGLSDEGIMGTWTSQELTRTSQVTTELIVSDLEELRLRKTCKIK